MNSQSLWPTHSYSHVHFLLQCSFHDMTNIGGNDVAPYWTNQDDTFIIQDVMFLVGPFLRYLLWAVPWHLDLVNKTLSHPLFPLFSCLTLHTALTGPDSLDHRKTAGDYHLKVNSAGNALLFFWRGKPWTMNAHQIFYNILRCIITKGLSLKVLNH